MRELKLLCSIGQIDDAMIAEAAPKLRKWSLKRITAAAACLALIITGGIWALRQSRINLDPMIAPIVLSERSSGVSVKHISGTIKQPDSSYCLVGMTIEEIFAANTLIVRGYVSGIENIELNFNGSKNYRAIATISINEVIRGEAIDDQIRILLPCPITGDVRMSATEVTAAMRVGMEGIFMPLVYAEDAYREENGATLYLTDIAPYGLSDGLRWIFLDGKDGLIFERSVYTEIRSAADLDEIEAYIREQLQ